MKDGISHHCFHNQEAVMADYKNAPIFRVNPKAGDYLHMFFSSDRVPVGLTDKEVGICIRLYPYRQRMIERYNAAEDAKLEKYLEPLPSPTFDDELSLIAAGVSNTTSEARNQLEHLWQMFEHLRRHPFRELPLPSELRPGAVMTRERFRRGVRLFIAEYRRRCGP